MPSAVWLVCGSFFGLSAWLSLLSRTGSHFWSIRSSSPSVITLGSHTALSNLCKDTAKGHYFFTTAAAAAAVCIAH